MFPLITFVVGIIIFVFMKNGFRLGNRMVPRAQARTIGLILMAPLVVEFCASSLLVTNYAEFGEDGTLTLSQDAFYEIAGTLGTVELISVIIAVGLSLYIIFANPMDVRSVVADVSSQKPSASQQQTPDIMTVTEAAAYMRVSESDVLELIEQGRLGAARIGSTYRIARIAIDDFMGRA